MNLTGEDQRHLREAQGWLELGDHIAAFETLEQIEALHRAHPDVLKIRYEIYAKAGKWESAFELAEVCLALCRTTSRRSCGARIQRVECQAAA